MVEFTVKDAEKLHQMLDDAVHFANMGSRTAYKAVQAMKPIIDTHLEKWATDAIKGKGPAK